MRKYEKVYHDLEDKITQNKYPRGSYLPSEKELCQSYTASRATVRQALDILCERGFIQKQKGRGSLVISSSKLEFPISGLTSYKELQDKLNFQSSTSIFCFEKITVDANLSELTKFPQGSFSWHILRGRKIDGKYVVLDEDYLKYDLAPNLTKEIAEDSLYEYLENKLNLEISYAQKEITIDLLHDLDKKYLNLSSFDHHVVSVKSHVYLADAMPFQYTESRHQVDRFRFTEFARRQKI